ncbi:DUF2283 domain-containing protein [Streptomyces sp. NPDC050448]|uniref:DUF2283 domain-containing protein n=1 Tax=Streptomyces sp. NPDC050448 TaxID=3155404 RepID=UPI00341E9BD2
MNVRVTYDKTVNAAYVYLTDPQVRAYSSHMYPCDPVDVGGMINLDFDEHGRLIGIEVLAAWHCSRDWTASAHGFGRRPDVVMFDVHEFGQHLLLWASTPCSRRHTAAAWGREVGAHRGPLGERAAAMRTPHAGLCALPAVSRPPHPDGDHGTCLWGDA